MAIDSANSPYFEHRASSIEHTGFAVELAEASYWSIGHNGKLLSSLATRQTVNLDIYLFCGNTLSWTPLDILVVEYLNG